MPFTKLRSACRTAVSPESPNGDCDNLPHGEAASWLSVVSVGKFHANTRKSAGPQYLDDLQKSLARKPQYIVLLAQAPVGKWRDVWNIRHGGLRYEDYQAAMLSGCSPGSAHRKMVLCAPPAKTTGKPVMRLIDPALGRIATRRYAAKSGHSHFQPRNSPQSHRWRQVTRREHARDLSRRRASFPKNECNGKV